MYEAASDPIDNEVLLARAILTGAFLAILLNQPRKDN
jgi:hypothetical protein